MYYVAKVHKNGNKLESVEICDTSDGIIDFILVEDLSDYKNFDIDGIDGTKVRVSKKALGDEYFNKILSKGKEDGTLPTISEKIHIPLIRISCDTRNISSSIQWYEKDYAYYIKDEDDEDDDVNGWFDCHELDIDLYAVINVESCSVDLAIEMTMYNHEIDTQQEVRISSIDVSAEVIKSICDNHGDAFKLSKIINGYFYNIGTLIEEVSEGKVGLGGFISLDDDIRYCDFTDSIVTIKDRSNSSLSYLTNDYICETNPEVRVYFESENKVVNLTGVDLSRRIDGVSPEGDISLSKYATDFHDKYRRNILKSALAGDCEFEDKIVFMLRMMGTGLSMNLSNNFLVRSTLFRVDFVIKYNFGDSIKDLYLKVNSYSCEHYVKLNCCDEFLSILESCYDSKDLDKACDSVISYFDRNDVFIKALQSDGVVEIHGLCDKNFASLVKECCVKEVFCKDS